MKWKKSVRGKNNVMDALVEKLFEKVIPRSLRPLQTGGRCIKPTLCHGDLWHGNIARNRKTHKLMLFHSCALYAHNECEIFKHCCMAMSNQLWFLELS